MQTDSENPERPRKRKKASPKKPVSPKSISSDQIQKLLKEVILKNVDEKNFEAIISFNDLISAYNQVHSTSY